MIHKNVFLGLGSNLGDRLDCLNKAVKKISQLPGTNLINYSSVYESEPVEYLEQANFLNMVVQLSTNFSPEQFLKETQKVENDLGRTREIPFGPRTIDIDILYWGDMKMTTQALKIPHPEAGNRGFVLKPLKEIAPDYHVPPHGLRVCELFNEPVDRGFVELFKAKTSFVIN